MINTVDIDKLNRVLKIESIERVRQMFDPISRDIYETYERVQPPLGYLADVWAVRAMLALVPLAGYHSWHICPPAPQSGDERNRKEWYVSVDGWYDSEGYGVTFAEAVFATLFDALVDD